MLFIQLKKKKKQKKKKNKKTRINLRENIIKYHRLFMLFKVSFLRESYLNYFIEGTLIFTF